MIVAEYKSAGVTVRIHDEYCNRATDQCLSELAHIISGSYKRRKMEFEPSIAAIQMMDEQAKKVL